MLRSTLSALVLTALEVDDAEVVRLADALAEGVIAEGVLDEGVVVEEVLDEGIVADRVLAVGPLDAVDAKASPPSLAPVRGCSPFFNCASWPPLDFAVDGPAHLLFRDLNRCCP